MNSISVARFKIHKGYTNSVHVVHMCKAIRTYKANNRQITTTPVTFAALGDR